MEVVEGDVDINTGLGILTSYSTSCALAPGFHFMDEPNLMFSGILALGE
jgi:hypothetical protein